MKKIQENKYIIIVLLMILVFIFYWFQVRPTNIKKDCSWVTETIPADPGVTKEQAEANKVEFEKRISGDYSSSVVMDRFTLSKNSKERLPSPEKIETREATDEEYKTCLRQNGL